MESYTLAAEMTTQFSPLERHVEDSGGKLVFLGLTAIAVFLIGFYVGQIYAFGQAREISRAETFTLIEAAQLRVSDAFAEANKFRASLYCAAVVPYPPYCEAYRVKP